MRETNEILHEKSKIRLQLVWVLIISAAIVMFSFILSSSACELIGYLQSDPDSFVGDKWGRTPAEFYSMRTFTTVCYSVIIVFPALLISMPFFHILIGYNTGKIVYYVQAIFSVILGVLCSSNKITELSALLPGGNFLTVHFFIILSYFSCTIFIMALLFPSSKLRMSKRMK